MPISVSAPYLPLDYVQPGQTALGAVVKSQSMGMVVAAAVAGKWVIGGDEDEDENVDVVEVASDGKVVDVKKGFL